MGVPPMSPPPIVGLPAHVPASPPARRLQLLATGYQLPTSVMLPPMTRVLLIPSLFLLLLGLLCFLLSASPDSSSAAAQKPITFCISDDIKTLDTGRMSWMNDLRIAMSLW